jgi:hypothetical protein
VIVADLVLALLPLWILLGVLLVVVVFALLGRFRGGRYVRPLVMQLARIPFMRRLMTKASTAALERQNPDLASAMKKLERLGPQLRDPRRAQGALSQLTPAERRAYFEAAGMEDQPGVEAMNREQRRRLEKAKRDSQRKR